MTAEMWLASLISGLLLGGLYVATALGLSMVFGVMRLVNVVHGELVLLGAYLSFVLFRELAVDPFVGLLAIMPALFVLGYMVQRWLLNPLVQQGMEAPMLATFGLSIVLQNLFLLIWKSNTRSVKTSYTENSVALGSIQIPQMYIVFFAIALVLALALHLFVTRTMVGKAIRATAQSSQTAAVMGVNVGQIYALTYGIGAAIAAVGGVMLATTFTFVPSTGMTYLLKGFVLVVLGGMGSIGGTLLGGVVLGMSESLGAAAFGTGYKDMVGLLIFLLVLTIRPSGLFGRK